MSRKSRASRGFFRFQPRSRLRSAATGFVAIDPILSATPNPISGLAATASPFW